MVFHQLDLQIMIRLIVVCDQVVDGFNEGTQGFTVIFFLKEELLLGEHLHEVHEAIAAFFAQRLGVGSKI